MAFKKEKNLTQTAFFQNPASALELSEACSCIKWSDQSEFIISLQSALAGPLFEILFVACLCHNCNSCCF